MNKMQNKGMKARVSTLHLLVPVLCVVFLLTQVVLKGILESGIFGQTRLVEVLIPFVFWMIASVFFTGASVYLGYKKKMCWMLYALSASICAGGFVVAFLTFESYWYVA